MTAREGVGDFDFLHGSWDVAHSIRRGRLSGSDEWDELHGRAVCAPILDGVGNLDQIWLPHRKAIGSTLRLYDANAGVWRLHWSASDAARLDQPLEGVFVDGVGTFFGSDHLGDRPIDVRFVWDDIGSHGARWTQSFAPAGTGEWEPNWVMRFSRISASAAAATTATLRLPSPSAHRPRTVGVPARGQPADGRSPGRDGKARLARFEGVPRLQRLNADHESALLAFELANRAYFAASISDRGEEYFEHFAERTAELLEEQQTGTCAYYVLVGDDGSILGRFNLRDIDHGSAVLGYRVAERDAGRGLATATVVRLCREAATTLGLRVVRAATSDTNAASRRVLVKAGFVLVGPADATELGGKPGSWYELRIAPDA